ncbi:WxL protein peptidoglycan domain-containing protein [Actinoplanes sp. N902-109]|uniref:COG1470 family protein n=1 Tax=Actinoplanes sp. (strain N902-109) TaxID=649831 RepID=UPI001E534635|nr:DUF916 domain-containing protein [Actinoplanes sp. N902-109]
MVLAPVLVAPTPAFADEGDVTWTVRTASNSYGADRSSYSYSVNPSGTAKDAMIVANRGKDPLTLAVYAADGLTAETGQLDLHARNDKPTGIGAWLTTGGGTIAVQPGRTVTVPFTVSVPANATPGDYVGGIVTSLTQPDQAQGINVERRLGIRIKLRVGGALTPNVAIENLHVDYHGTWNPFSKGDATVSYTIHNTGNTAQSAQQAVAVAGPFGWFRTSSAQPAASPELLPGESWRMTVPVEGVTPALWAGATTTLTPLLTDASGSISPLPAVVATAHGPAVPWTLVVVLVVLVALVIASRFLRVRRKAREDARVQQAVEQALAQV